jgi:hypothetical protein
MDKALIFFLLYCLLWSGVSLTPGPLPVAVHTSMPQAFEGIRSTEEAFSVFDPQHELEPPVQLCRDANGAPRLYYADLQTPVCIDGICKPVRIAVYWNLLGAYIGYGLYDGDPLTKYDHDLFEEADYAKLHELLLNKNAVFRRKKLSDLFDPNAEPEKQVTYKGEEVDAVSGATKKAIKDAVVEGALYSCYTIWQVVHGTADDSIKVQLPDLWDEELLHRFLYAERDDYQFHALRQLPDSAYATYSTRLLQLFAESNPLFRTKLLKQLPDPYWGEAVWQEKLYGSFNQLDVNTRTLLISGLEKAGENAALRLLPHLHVLTKNQLKAYLSFWEDRAIPPDAQNMLAEAGQDTEYAYAYLIKRFLQARKTP